jgi:hypothetical protein
MRPDPRHTTTQRTVHALDGDASGDASGEIGRRLVDIGLGRIVALYHRASTSHQIH